MNRLAAMVLGGSEQLAALRGARLVALSVAALVAVAGSAQAQTAPVKIARDAGHGIQSVLECTPVDAQTGRWTAAFSSSSAQPALIQWDVRTPDAPLTWTLGSGETVGGWSFRAQHANPWSLTLTAPCQRQPAPTVAVEPFPGYDWSGPLVASQTAAQAPNNPPRRDPVAPPPAAVDPTSGDPIPGYQVGAINTTSSSSTGSSSTGGASGTTREARQDSGGVSAAAHDADQMFDEVLPTLDQTFVSQLAASGNDPVSSAPPMGSGLDERANLEASAVGNCTRERAIFAGLMRQFDDLHHQLVPGGTGLRPYGLNSSALPQAAMVKAAIVEAEIARYTWLCSEHTDSGEILVRRAVSEYLLASTWARLAGSPEMFTTLKAAAFALAQHVPHMQAVRGYTYQDLSTFCAKNAPDQGRYFPDLGVLMPDAIWHQQCDAYPA